MNMNIYKLLGVTLLSLSAGVLAVDEQNSTVAQLTNSGQTSDEARAAAEAKIARLKAAMDAKADAARAKSEQQAKATADAQVKKDVLARAKQQAAEAKTAQLQAEQADKAEAARVKAEQDSKPAAELAKNQPVVDEDKARAEAEAKVAKLKAAQDAKANATRMKSEQQAQAAADAQAKKDALSKAKQQAAEAKAAQLQAEQAAKAEAARVKVEQDAKAAADKQAAEAAKAQQAQTAQAAEAEKARLAAEAKVAQLKAQQDAKAEAERVKAEQKAKAAAEAEAKKDALAQAKQQAAEAKAAQLQAEQATKAEAARVKAEQDAKITAEKQSADAANAQALQAVKEEKLRAAAEAKTAKLKADQEARAEAARVKSEQQAKAAAEAQAKQQALAKAKQDAADAKAAQLQAEQAAKAETTRVKAEQDAKAKAEEQSRLAAAAQEEAARAQAQAQVQAEMNAKAAKFATWEELKQHVQTRGIHLVMDPKDAQHLFNKEPTDKSSFPVQFKDGDISLNGRVSVKGSSTRNFLKKSLIIKFDHGTSWHGQSIISLDAMATDVTEAHQWLAHDLMVRMKMATPEMMFTNLNINGKGIGRYLMVEWIKPAMFERFGLGADGELYNPNDTYYCGNFQPEDFKRLDKCFTRLDGGKDLSRLEQLAQELNSVPVDKFDEYLDQHFDGDSVINWLVLNTLSGSEDTYNKNFFLYYSNQTHKWTLVPWDYDMAFGRVADNGVAYPRSIFNTHFQYMHSPEAGAASPLKEKTLKNNVLYKKYLAKVRELFADEPLRTGAMGGWYNPRNFSQILDQKRSETHASIISEMYANPDKADFSYMYDALRFFNEWRYQYLNKLMLVPSIWNTPIWLPYKSFDPIEPRQADYYNKRHREPLNLVGTGNVSENGKRVFFIDPMLGVPLAAIDVLSLSKPSRIDIQVSTQQEPPAVPKGLDAATCLERTWHINNRTPDSQIKANLEIDYLNEGSTRHELGDKIKSELGLTIWSNFDGEWLPLTSHINPRSNSFIVWNMVLDTGDYTLVACVDPKQEAIAKAKAKLNPASQDENSQKKVSRLEKQLKAEQEDEASQNAEALQHAEVHNRVMSAKTATVTPPPVVNSTQLQADGKAEKARLAAEAKVAQLKAQQDAKAEGERVKAEQKAKAAAEAQAKKDALAQAKQQAAEAKAAQLQAEQAAKAEADAKAAADAQARKEALAQAKREAAEAKAAKLKDAQEAEAARIKAEQEAKAVADEQAVKSTALAPVNSDAASEAARAEAEARIAKLRAAQNSKADIARLKTDQKAKAAAEAQAKKDVLAQAKKDAAEARAVQAEEKRIKAEQDAKAQAEIQARKQAEMPNWPKAIAVSVEQPATSEDKARAEAEARIAKIKAAMDAKQTKKSP